MRSAKLKPKGVVIIHAAPLANFLGRGVATRLNKKFKVSRAVNDNARSFERAGFFGRLFQRLQSALLRLR